MKSWISFLLCVSMFCCPLIITFLSERGYLASPYNLVKTRIDCICYWMTCSLDFDGFQFCSLLKRLPAKIHVLWSCIPFWLVSHYFLQSWKIISTNFYLSSSIKLGPALVGFCLVLFALATSTSTSTNILQKFVCGSPEVILAQYIVPTTRKISRPSFLSG